MRIESGAAFRAVLVLLLLGACAPISGSQAPSNLGTLKTELIAYQHSGAYDRDIAAVEAQALAYIQGPAGRTAHGAVVLDIDETSLSNWPQMAADDFGYIPDGACDHLPRGPCGARAWEMSARATAIPPTVALFNVARLLGLAVFFITGRSEAERAATETNLRAAGYQGWAGLVLKNDQNSRAGSSAADYKGPARARIEGQGFHIIANIGDQPSDLAGGHADRTFLLPNPFYHID